MVNETKDGRVKTGKHPLVQVYDFLSGFKLATVLMLLLFVLTWLATLEQIDKGLYPTLRKYFDWRSLFLIPEINGKTVPLPLPGGYYVSALLLLNMTLGGVVRIRKGWRQAGNLVSHFGIIFMLLGGGVAHHFSERGNMAVGEGEVSDTAEDYFEYVLEVAEVKDGVHEEIMVIRGDYLTDLTRGKTRLFEFENFPFSLEVSGYLKNAQPVGQAERAPGNREFVADGYWLMEKPDEINAEANLAACYARVVLENGEKGPPFIVAGASFFPHTVQVGDRLFTVDMRKRLWPMPFEVKLDTFTAEFRPGTSIAAKFISDIRRVEDGREAKVRVEMNEPMRYDGFTFFQASYGPPGAGPGDKMYSVFEIVKNPADMWPEWALYVVTVGMLITFLTKLGSHLGASSRKRRKS